jgi:hypothetical protein
VWAILLTAFGSFLCVNLFPMSLYVHPDQRVFTDEIVSMISESQNRGEKHAPVRNGTRSLRRNAGFSSGILQHEQVLTYR